MTRVAGVGSDEPVPNVGLALRYTLRSFTRALNAAAAPWELTVAEFRLLRCLAEERASTHAELAEAAVMDRPYVSALVKKMAARGMLAVAPHPADRRRLVVEMTTEGQQVFTDLSRQTELVNAAATEGIAAADLQCTLAVLSRLTSNLQAHQAGTDVRKRANR